MTTVIRMMVLVMMNCNIANDESGDGDDCDDDQNGGRDIYGYIWIVVTITTSMMMMMTMMMMMMTMMMTMIKNYLRTDLAPLMLCQNLPNIKMADVLFDFFI